MTDEVEKIIGKKVTLKSITGVSPAWYGYGGTIVKVLPGQDYPPFSSEWKVRVRFATVPGGFGPSTHTLSWNLLYMAIENYGEEDD